MHAQRQDRVGQRMSLSLPRPCLIDRPASGAGAMRAAWRLPAALSTALLAHFALLLIVLRWTTPAAISPPDPPGFGMVITAPAPFAAPRAGNARATLPPVAPPAAPPLTAVTTATPNDPPRLATAEALSVLHSPVRPPIPTHPIRRPIARPAPHQTQSETTIVPAGVPAGVPAEAGATAIAPRGSPPGANVPPAQAADDAGAIARLQAEIGRAVQAAARMPETARRQRRVGSAQIAFGYLDGAVNAVRIVKSSQSRVLDDAALQAVQQAHYPTPLPATHGRRLALLVWIDFRLAPSPG